MLIPKLLSLFYWSAGVLIADLGDRNEQCSKLSFIAENFCFKVAMIAINISSWSLKQLTFLLH